MFGDIATTLWLAHGLSKYEFVYTQPTFSLCSHNSALTDFSHFNTVGKLLRWTKPKLCKKFQDDGERIGVEVVAYFQICNAFFCAQITPKCSDQFDHSKQLKRFVGGLVGTRLRLVQNLGKLRL